MTQQRKIMSLAAAAVLASAGIASADSMTFTPNRDDTILAHPTYENFNFGTDVATAVGGFLGYHEDFLVGFDTSALPASSVNSITLRFFTYVNDSSTYPRTIDVLEVSDANGDWSQGDGATLGASWDFKERSTSTPWAGGAGLLTPITSYAATPLASTTLSTGPGPAALSAVDFAFTGTSPQLTALLNDWNTGGNNGLLLRDPAEASYASTDRLLFYSSEIGDPTLRPQLIVNYTVPEPASLALLALGSLLVVRRRRVFA